MKRSSQNSPGTENSLALDPDIAARLGVKRYRLIKQWISEVNGPFDAVVAPCVAGSKVVLDAGCSRGDPDLPSVRDSAHPVAYDADLAGLRANTLVRDRVQGMLEALPFRSESFDVVVCKFVVEHLESPQTTFREFWRVLRPGGVVAVLTTNRWSPFAVVSRLVPYRAKQALKSRLFGGHDEDTFRAVYRANSARRLRALMDGAGFAEKRLEMLAGMWAFFIFSGALARAVRAAERACGRLPGLHRGGTYLMGLWQKPVMAPVD
jgi:ubiquinone/menaquinone biosynthesis C-methylase UbiE